MCNAPIRLPNPYYGHQNLADHAGSGARKKVLQFSGKDKLSRSNTFIPDKYGFLHDTQNKYIEVPCGHCSACIATKQSYAIQKCQLLSMTHEIYMVMLSYRQDALPFVVINGYKHYYADYGDFQKMIKRLRISNALGCDFKTFCITEYGGEKHRPHFHCLFFIPKSRFTSEWDKLKFDTHIHKTILSEWKRNYGSDRYPIWKPLCIYKDYWKNGVHKRNYQCDRVKPMKYKDGSKYTNPVNNVAHYVTKYFLKFDKWLARKKSAMYFNLSPEEFTRCWKLLKPRYNFSKNCISRKDKVTNVITTHPEVLAHISKCIKYSINHPDGAWSYISPVDGNISPLSPFIRKRYVTPVDAMERFYRQKGSDIDCTPDGMTPEDASFKVSQVSQHERVRKKVVRLLSERCNLDISDVPIDEQYDIPQSMLDDWSYDFDSFQEDYKKGLDLSSDTSFTSERTPLSHFKKDLLLFDF